MNARLKSNKKKGVFYVIMFLILLVHSWMSDGASMRLRESKASKQTEVYSAEKDQVLLD
jgi:hypothetical protein